MATFNPEYTKYVMNEALKNNKKVWFNNPLSIKIAEKKYLHPDETSMEDLINRVSTIFSTYELQHAVRMLMINGTFFPGGRSLYGAGSKGKFNATMSNCYTVDVEDSLESIYESNKNIATIFKSGGGIGLDISPLRPNGAKTNNAARTSTGAVSFIHLYNTTGSIVGFHGRRGATLIGLRMSHPDIEEFIDLRKSAEISAMNISCIIDDEFMKAVRNDGEYNLYFDIEATGEHIEKTVSAKKLFKKLCTMGWDYGDPGILFKKSVDSNNMMSAHPKFNIDISNPCAEYTGPAYSSCNLGSLNLYNFVNFKFSKHAYFDMDEFKLAIHTAVKALDEILDYGYELQPLDKNREVITKWRPIGLGFFGFADALIALGITYGSAQSIEFAQTISRVLMNTAVNASSMIAKEKGSFGEFDLKYFLNSEFVNTRLDKDTIKLVEQNGLRNAQLISVAPTGSLSLLAGQLSSGIEPIFKCVYERSTHNLEKENIGFTVADRAIDELLEYNKIEPGSISSDEIKQRFPFVVEAQDIEPIQRVRVQAAIQRFIDNAISSTVNLPESATVEDVENIYMKAWALELKGITVFRDNCKRASILGFSDKKEEQKQESRENTLVPEPRKGKGPLEGRTYRKKTACVKALYVTVNKDENGRIFEVFTNKSIHGCSANIATITRLVSMGLRSGIDPKYICKELRENVCQACQAKLGQDMKDHNYDLTSLSCPIAIAECIEDELKRTSTREIEPEPVHNIVIEESEGQLECPECGERTLIVEGKCVTCKRCGYSKCD